MWARSLAAALLGLPLTVGIIGLVALLWPGDITRTTLPWLLLAFPTWIAVMSLAFLARSGRRAWLWMGGATLLCFGLVQLARMMGWAAEMSA